MWRSAIQSRPKAAPSRSLIEQSEKRWFAVADMPPALAFDALNRQQPRIILRAICFLDLIHRREVAPVAGGADRNAPRRFMRAGKFEVPAGIAASHVVRRESDD